MTAKNTETSGWPGRASTAVGREIGLELADFNGDDSHELPAASALVISRAGTVRLGPISGDYRWRVGPGEVLAVLKPSAS
jgi:hypothetical protein